MKSNAGRVKEDYLNRIKKLRNVARLWKQIADAQTRMLAAYRMGRPPACGAIDLAMAATAKLRELGEID
ncbi:MAG: hypothetical protein V3R87_09310 [Dehalococcoidia bacterium]